MEPAFLTFSESTNPCFKALQAKNAVNVTGPPAQAPNQSPYRPPSSMIQFTKLRRLHHPKVRTLKGKLTPPLLYQSYEA